MIKSVVEEIPPPNQKPNNYSGVVECTILDQIIFEVLVCSCLMCLIVVNKHYRRVGFQIYTNQQTNTVSYCLNPCSRSSGYILSPHFVFQQSIL